MAGGLRSCSFERVCWANCIVPNKLLAEDAEVVCQNALDFRQEVEPRCRGTLSSSLLARQNPLDGKSVVVEKRMGA